MHSHQGLQEQLLLNAPLIIRDQRDRPGEQEIVLMLGDFSFKSPEQIFAELRQASGMKPMVRPAAAMKPDLNDVTYDAFLANDRILADPEAVKVEPGASVLLRVINASSMSAYHLDLGQLPGQLIAVDGFEVVPISGLRFPIAVAQRQGSSAAGAGIGRAGRTGADQPHHDAAPDAPARP